CIRCRNVTGVQTCALPISAGNGSFEEQALMAGVFVGVYLVLVLLALIAVILMMAKASTKRYNFALVSAVLLLVGSGIAYLLVARSEERRVGKEVCIGRQST